MLAQMEVPPEQLLFGFKFDETGYYRYYDTDTHQFSAPGRLIQIHNIVQPDESWEILKSQGYSELLDGTTDVLVLDFFRCYIYQAGELLGDLWKGMNTKVVDTEEDIKVPVLPTPLPKKSPLRLVPIDVLENGEEVLPNNFTIVFSPTWLAHEVRGMNGLYQKILPVIGVQGKVVFVNSQFQGGTVEHFLNKQRRR